MTVRGYIVGVDTGGTFTDVAVLAETGELVLDKAPTTPDDFSRGVLDALEGAARSLGLDLRGLLGRCRLFKHGTTVGTNALITRTGARVGFITTRGFEDTTLIMRAVGRVDGLQEDEIKHMAHVTKPAPLVPRGLIKGVRERVDFQGNVVAPLNVED
ncbi:MAG: hydantoinase/oxoprolinase family protein, partial [Deltaproteobacteria bacterium]|nr:hydantoinase/oxoprolinase family protein [Deltaproteobacteria bacterium]